MRRNAHTLITAVLIGAMIGGGSVLLFEQRGQATGDPGSLVGQASVIDGDTIEIHGRRIRLWGIDAPESRQTCQDQNDHEYRCGQVAANALADKIGRHVVDCQQRGTDRYHRVVAVCRADGVELGRWLVEQGFAVEWRRYSGGFYSDADDLARTNHAGVWAGTFQFPWDWRAEHR